MADSNFFKPGASFKKIFNHTVLLCEEEGIVRLCVQHQT